MIDLVLHAGGEQPVGLHLLLRPRHVQVAHPHPGGTGDVGILAGQGKASLLTGGQFLAGGDHLGVDHPERLRLVLRHQVHNQHPQLLPDLRRSQADARGLIHRGEHARQQFAHRVLIRRPDRAAAGAQRGVRRDQDRQGIGVVKDQGFGWHDPHLAAQPRRINGSGHHRSPLQSRWAVPKCCAARMPLRVLAQASLAGGGLV